MTNIAQIIKKIKKVSPEVDENEIQRAYEFAKKYHQGQKRKTGEPYIQHPLGVTHQLANFRFNTATYVAALLHDTIEDTKLDLKTLKNEFGNEVARLVNGVTKLSRIRFKQDFKSYSIENLRKMFLAMAADIRVVLIKLFDRYHNLQSLNSFSRPKQKRIASETIEIYAPLAYRLGIGELKGQLEDLAFPYLHPREYKWVTKLAQQETEKREEYIEKAKKMLAEKLEKAGIEFLDIHGRKKHLYSLYKKLLKHNRNINDIYDLLALRVIVKTVADCYKTLGIIHQDWKPLIGRIKDYIAVPKVNGYQSLHTTVITQDGEILEIQIRTLKMHQEAEYGIAASWYYSENGKPDEGSIVPKKMAWINQLIEWQKEIKDNKKFAESLKIDFFHDRIYVFTPQGDILDLPEGSTPVDFAYQIHTEVGHHCSAAIVNDKLVSLDHRLDNGDVVKIITEKKKGPKRDWLNFVVTQQAKNRIKNWFKKLDYQKNLEYGRNILNQQLFYLKRETLKKLNKTKIQKLLQKFPYKSFDNLLAAIGQGEINPKQVIKYLYQEDELLQPKQKRFIFFGKPVNQPRAIIEGEKGLLTNIAKCCNPSVNDKIKAYITRSKGASIHKANCPELKKKKVKGRILDAYWEKDYQDYRLVDIEIQSLNRIGLLKDITTTISNMRININSFRSVSDKNDIISFYLTLEIKNIEQLVDLLKQISKIKGVMKVFRK